jgi:hypothetical protein
MPEPDDFLFAHDGAAPRRKLIGLCFTGSDVVVGDLGYEKYAERERKRIEPGEDGAYIVVNTDNGSATIGTDFSGYYKLFAYRSGDTWALSNSIVSLVENARAKSLPVTILPAHLAGFLIPGAFGNQIASLQTAVREIRLIPATELAVVREDPVTKKLSLSTRRTARVEELDLRGPSYGGALAEALRVWVGRMGALAMSDLDVVCKLTGGRDSRAVLSLLLAAAQRSSAGFRGVTFVSKETAQQDLAIAKDLAKHYGLALNTQRRHHPDRPLPDRDAYQRWRRLCLGIYTPIYFPSRHPNPMSLTLGGAGGESHRPFFRSRTLANMLDAQRAVFPSGGQFDEFRGAVLSDIAGLQMGFEADLDPLTLHYRHFRDRMHGGRSPQYIFQASPLASAYFRRASALCPPKHRERAQFLIDLMMNCAAGIVDMPYDARGKAPDRRHKRDFTDVRDALDLIQPGTVYTATSLGDLDVEDATDGHQNIWCRLLDDLLRHEGRLRRSGLFRTEYIDQAVSIARKAAETRQLTSASAGAPISHLLFAALLLG